MKKMILVLVTILASIGFTTNCFAGVNNELLEYAKTTHFIAGDYVRLSDADILKVERFLREYPITDSEASQIIEKANQIIDILNEAGISDLTKLSKEAKQEVFSLAQEAANIIGATLTYNNTDKTIVIYKDGVKIEALSLNPYLKQTGKSNIITISIAAITVLGATIVYRKRHNA